VKAERGAMSPPLPAPAPVLLHDAHEGIGAFEEKRGPNSEDR
jgi:hypothetical protein